MHSSSAVLTTHHAVPADKDKLQLRRANCSLCVCPGVDALSVHLILTVIAATLSIGISWKAVVGSLGIMIPWQLAHWEEYHTGQIRVACCTAASCLQ